MKHLILLSSFFFLTLKGCGMTVSRRRPRWSQRPTRRVVTRTYPYLGLQISDSSLFPLTLFGYFTFTLICLTNKARFSLPPFLLAFDSILVSSWIYGHPTTLKSYEGSHELKLLRFVYLGKWSPCVCELLNTSGKYYVLCALYFMSNFTLT
jgi:hypothetical protein